ncbi:MAG TPA: protein-glutamate O-methyltransferase CheR [Candidatus Acidoferrum sp.]|nr:protein-glutamate O-methyltransferase CheR [Candidatus Acidoferrum sp.]
MQPQSCKGGDITDVEYARVRKMIFEQAGISLGDAKKTLVVSRLTRRLDEYGLNSFTEYLGLLNDDAYPDELQTAVDLLTTNETYFFREDPHFALLNRIAAAHRGNQPLRVWSAACSNGQEAYSIAMVLEDVLDGRPWEIVGSDISTRVIETAKAGLYPIDQASKIPADYLARFCLRGVGSKQGMFAIDDSLRRHIRFFHGNLLDATPAIGRFDVIFLRNVMIYFNLDTKRDVVARLQESLKPGGYLLTGHSETLNGVSDALKMVAPSVYQKP